MPSAPVTLAIAVFCPPANAAAAAFADRSVRIHGRVLQLANQFVHLEAVGAHRLGFQDLPVGAGAAEFQRRFPGDVELHAAELVLIEHQQMLLAQILGLLVERGLAEAGDGEQALVAVEHRVGIAFGGRILADAQRVSFPVRHGEGHADARRIQAIGRKIARILVHHTIRGKTG